jgi:hypothetical protein
LAAYSGDVQQLIREAKDARKVFAQASFYVPI